MPARRPSTTSPRSGRCLVPADGWFEWQQTGRGKQPYYLTPADGSPLSFAALWERWDPGGGPLETLTIITTAASPDLEDIHHRQPAIIEPRWFSECLDGANEDSQFRTSHVA